VDLGWRDRVNMGLHNFGLPPLPTNYNMFGGMPPGFTETNRFGGGAPVFTPPGFSGPNWSPGGSIFGGTLSPTGWVAGGGSPGNLGGSGGNLGNFGDIIGNTELRHVLQFGQLPQGAFGERRGTWTPQQAAHWRDVFASRGYVYPPRTGGKETVSQGMGGAGRPITSTT
jgi:hypothetical protein